MTHERRQPRRGLTTKVVIGLIVTLSLGMVPLAFWMVKQELLTRAGEGLALGAAAIADKLDILLTERLGDIQVFAASPQINDRNPETIRAYLHELKQAYHPVYARISVMDAEGRLIATTDPSPGDETVLHEPWFERVRQYERPDIEVVFPQGQPHNNMAALRYAAPIHGSQRQARAVISAEIDQQIFRELVTHTVRRGDLSPLRPVLDEFLVLDTAGQVLLTSSGAFSSTTVRTATDLFRDGNTGYLEDLSNISGRTAMIGYAPLQMQGVPRAQARWGVLVSVDRETVLQSTWNILWKVLGIGAAGLLPLLGLFLWARCRQTNEELQAATARTALETNDARIRTILDHALDAVVSIDSHGVVIEWNPQAEQTFGFTPQEALGKTLHSLIIPEAFRDAHQKGLRHYMNSGQHAILNRRIEINALHKNGHEFPVELTVIPLRIGDHVSFCAFLRDITEQKRSQKDLQDSKAFLGSIVEHLPTMVFVKDARDLRFVRANKATEDVIGVSEAELIGLNDYDFFLQRSGRFLFRQGSRGP
jgi:two-component system, cell cycle sensor histidine kinase and response regulator CckA